MYKNNTVLIYINLRCQYFNVIMALDVQLEAMLERLENKRVARLLLD
jgi:hypothetical protein